MSNTTATNWADEADAHAANVAAPATTNGIAFTPMPAADLEEIRAAARAEALAQIAAEAKANAKAEARAKIFAEEKAKALAEARAAAKPAAVKPRFQAAKAPKADPEVAAKPVYKFTFLGVMFAFYLREMAQRVKNALTVLKTDPSKIPRVFFPFEAQRIQIVLPCGEKKVNFFHVCHYGPMEERGGYKERKTLTNLLKHWGKPVAPFDFLKSVMSRYGLFLVDTNEHQEPNIVLSSTRTGLKLPKSTWHNLQIPFQVTNAPQIERALAEIEGVIEVETAEIMSYLRDEMNATVSLMTKEEYIAKKPQKDPKVAAKPEGAFTEQESNNAKLQAQVAALQAKLAAFLVTKPPASPTEEEKQKRAKEMEARQAELFMQRQKRIEAAQKAAKKLAELN